jgi:hypothetical protein
MNTSGRRRSVISARRGNTAFPAGHICPAPTFCHPFAPRKAVSGIGLAQDLQGRELHHNYRERLDRLDDLSGSWLIQIGDCGRAPAGLNKRLLTGWNGCNMFEAHLRGRGCRGSVAYARCKALRFVRYAIALRGAGAALHPFSAALGKISELPSVKTIEWE